MILIIKKFRSKLSLIKTSTIAWHYSSFNDTTDVTQCTSAHLEGSSIPSSVERTEYDLLMMNLVDIVPSPLTTMVLPDPNLEPVCEMRVLSLITVTLLHLFRSSRTATPLIIGSDIHSPEITNLLGSAKLSPEILHEERQTAPKVHRYSP